MHSTILSDEAERTYALVFDPDEEVAEGLLTFAKENQITAARFTAIGAFESVTLGWFNLDTNDYDAIPINEQVEVLSLVGNIALHDDEPKVHAHLVVGKRDGSAHGGHLLQARVRPTLEVMLITETQRHLQRKTDPATGLALLDLEAASLPHRRGRSLEAETE